MPRAVRTRDGRVIPFDEHRIRAAVERAVGEVGRRDAALPRRITRDAVADLTERFPRSTPGVEDVQDAVERALMAAGLVDVARAYVVFRNRRAELREAKRMLGVRDELKLSLGACAVLAERYLQRDERGRVTESTGEMLARVAERVAGAEDGYPNGRRAAMTEAFARAMSSLDFLPNSPTLMNAGTPLGLLSACFVLPLEDSLDSIFTTLLHAARIHQAGGGTGFSFSRLRPAGDRVASTGGIASGPLSFLDVYDLATEVVGRGGRRRGANMAVLDVSHPDLREFVTAKLEPGRLEHCNLSVAVTDAFMRAVCSGGSHRFVNPRSGRVVSEVDAAALFDLIASAAWESGDPGLLFLDRVNRSNPVPAAGRIEATNPCGEVPLLPNESCTLASVNLSKHVRDGRVDWARIDTTVELVVRFLDDVLDVNRYPDPALGVAAAATRKIGVGIMGLAEMLAMLRVAYDSEEAVRLAGRVAARVRSAARRASAELAAERGAFPDFDRSVFARRGGAPVRHAQLTSVAPTGTISLIAGTTSSIEPMFAVAYVRRVLGRGLLEVNPLFDRTARDLGFWSDSLMSEIARTGTVRECEHVPEEVRRSFVTAFDVAPEWHVRMQAAVQRHVDAAVAKTINLPSTVTVSDVRTIFLEAWRARVKGVTVYRDGSRPGQVLTVPGAAGEPVSVDLNYAGGCAGMACPL